MSIPITGYVLIPLGLLIVILPWRYCLIALVAFAMLSAAAVVNVGRLGLQPGYYLSILLIGRTAAAIMFDRFTLNGFVLARMRLLFYFFIVVLVVLFIALCFFQGQIETLRGTMGYKSNLTQPFHLARENFTQIAYLILNVLLIYAVGHQGAQQPIQKLLKGWDAALVCGLCFAAAICLWQFTSFYAGVYFPADFFYSNAGYNRADSQSMAGLLRINGPFEEPSALGYYFTGYIMFAWARYRRYPTAFSVAMLAACIFCMLVSTSTTAFFGLFLFSCVVVFDVATGRVHLLTKDLNLSSGQIAAIGIAVIAVLGGGFVVAKNWQAIHVILQNTVFHKTESTSFQGRSFAELLGMRIFVETYGIGIGLGSHKPNSLVMTLLSNTGIAGFISFGAFIYTLLRPIRTRFDGQTTEMYRQAIQPFQRGLFGLILIHMFSNPNLGTLFLWLEIGGMLALLASLHRTATFPAAPDTAPLQESPAKARTPA